MTALEQASPLRYRPPFDTHTLGAAHDEMFDAQGTPRESYRALFESLLQLPAEEMRHRQEAANLYFLHQGITFTVYGQDEGTERIFPFDLLPRILTHGVWSAVWLSVSRRSIFS